MIQSGEASSFDLTGKVAIVTGGNGGIGLAMAEGLAAAGAAVAIAARSRRKADAALARLESLGASTMFVPTDVADRNSCTRMAETVADRFGRLDLLIANAGIGQSQRASDMAEHEWRRTIGINLDGAFFSAQAAYPHLKSSGGGKIVMIGSMTSIFGAPSAVDYAASKGGVVQLARSLAVAWALDNIQVNTILPGWIQTDIIAKRKMENPAFDAAIVNRTPARRWGEPRDISGTAVFLCSAASDFVTGAVIPVDGGYSVM